VLLNQVVNTLVTIDISNTAVVASGKPTNGQKSHCTLTGLHTYKKILQWMLLLENSEIWSSTVLQRNRPINILECFTDFLA